MSESYRERARRVRDTLGPSVRKTLSDTAGAIQAKAEPISDWFNAALATDWSKELDNGMGKLFAGKATIYDKAMDAVYNRTHIGGFDHRLFDGSHTLWGAWDAVSHAHHGDTFAAQVNAYAAALWKDMVTPKGLPIATFDRDHFHSTIQSVHAHLGVSPEWMKHMVTYTATETIGVATGIVAIALNWDGADIERFSGLVGSYATSAVIGGNPLLAVFAVVTLARAYQLARGEHETNLMLKSGLRGGFGSATCVGVAAVLGSHVWIGMMFGICAGVIARKGFDLSGHLLSRVDWCDVATFVYRYLKAEMAKPAAERGPRAYLPAPT